MTTPLEAPCVCHVVRGRGKTGSDDTSDSCSADEDMFQTIGIGGNRLSARKRKRGRKERLKEMTTDCQQAELKTYFRNAGFDGDPEKVAYLNYKPDLGNTKRVCCDCSIVPLIIWICA